MPLLTPRGMQPPLSSPYPCSVCRLPCFKGCFLPAFSCDFRRFFGVWKSPQAMLLQLPSQCCLVLWCIPECRNSGCFQTASVMLGAGQQNGRAAFGKQCHAPQCHHGPSARWGPAEVTHWTHSSTRTAGTDAWPKAKVHAGFLGGIFASSWCASEEGLPLL